MQETQFTDSDHTKVLPLGVKKIILKQSHQVNMNERDTEKLEHRIKHLEDELERIHQRNTKVDENKAWESSRCRVLFLVGLTYGVTTLVFWLIGAPSPLLSALIPSTAYYLSTLSLPIVQKWWLDRRNSKAKSNKG